MSTKFIRRQLRLLQLLRHNGGRPAMPRQQVAGTVRALLEHADKLTPDILYMLEEERRSLSAAESCGGTNTDLLVQHHRYHAERAARRAQELSRDRSRCRELAFQLEHCDEHEDCRQSPDLAKTCLATQREQTKGEI